MFKKILQNGKTTFIGICIIVSAGYNYFQQKITFEQFLTILTTGAGFIITKDADKEN